MIHRLPWLGGMGRCPGSVGGSINLTVPVGGTPWPRREFCVLVIVLGHFLKGGINVNDKVYLDRQKYQYQSNQYLNVLISSFTFLVFIVNL